MIEISGGFTRSDIMNFIYNNEKNKIAALFPIVCDYAREGEILMQ